MEIEPPDLPLGRPFEFAYLDQSSVAVAVTRDLQPDLHKLVVISDEGDLIDEWQGGPSRFGWQPTSVAVDTRAESAYVALGDAEHPVLAFDTSGQFQSALQRASTDLLISPWLVRVAPGGEVYMAAGLHAGAARFQRWLPPDTRGRAWVPRGQTGMLGLSTLEDMFIDSAGRVVLADYSMPGGGEDRITRLSRFSQSGAFLDQLTLQWPREVGPIRTSDPIRAEAVAADHTRGLLLSVDTSAGVHPFYGRHVFRYDNSAEFVSAIPLWRLSHGWHSTSVQPFVASNPWGGLAVNWTPHNRVDSAAFGGAGVTQFSEDGRLQSVARFQPAAGSAEETWMRARVATGDRVHILFPGLGVVGLIDSSGRLGWRRQAPPFGMDIASAETGSVAVRWWDGQEGKLALYRGDGTTQWRAPCDCPLSTGLAIDAAHVFASDPTSRSVQSFGIATGARDGELAPTDAPAGWPTDIAATGDGRLIAVDHKGRIDLYDWPARRLLRSWNAFGAASPVSVAAAEGFAAVLLSDNSVEVWTVEGEMFGSWRPEPASGIQPVDLAVDHQGVVTVLDAARPALVTLARRDSEAEPREDGSHGPGVCTVGGDKQASPSRITLGQSVTVSLDLSATCPLPAAGADVVLALDPSTAFHYEYAHERVEETVSQLARALDVSRIRVGVVGLVTGTETAEVLSPLGSSNHEALAAALSPERFDFTTQSAGYSGQMLWPDVLEVAAEHLRTNHQPGAEQVIVYIGKEIAAASGETARAFRALGGNVFVLQVPYENPTLLDDRLPEVDDIQFVAHAGDVAAVVRRIQMLVDQPTLREINVVDQLASDVQLETGSGRPPAAESEGQLMWSLPTLDPGGERMTYRVTPMRVGRYPTNASAVAYYTDADGERRSFTFPVPMIEVVQPPGFPMPGETPQPSQTPTHTPTARSTQSLYLPIALAEKCDLMRTTSDIVLALDTSGSMAGDKLDAAKRASLYFVSLVDLEPDRSQVAVVRFDHDAELVRRLTRDRALVSDSVQGLEVRSGTRIDEGLRIALDELRSPRRSKQNLPVVILLTDGVHNGVPGAEMHAAAEVRAADVRFYAIGLGADVDAAKLSEMVGDERRYYFAPNASDLDQIYADIAADLICPERVHWGGR